MSQNPPITSAAADDAYNKPLEWRCGILLLRSPIAAEKADIPATAPAPNPAR